MAGHADRITDCILEETSHRCDNQFRARFEWHVYRLLTASWDKSVALWDMTGSATNKIVCFTVAVYCKAEDASLYIYSGVTVSPLCSCPATST